MTPPVTYVPFAERSSLCPESTRTLLRILCISIVSLFALPRTQGSSTTPPVSARGKPKRKRAQLMALKAPDPATTQPSSIRRYRRDGLQEWRYWSHTGDRGRRSYLCKDVSRELIAGARNRCSIQLGMGMGMGHSGSSPAAGR